MNSTVKYQWASGLRASIPFFPLPHPLPSTFLRSPHFLCCPNVKFRLLRTGTLAKQARIQVLYCERSSAKIYQLKRIINLFYLFATAATGQVAFRGYARVVRVRQLCQILPSSFASVRRHLVDRTPVRRKILKPTPKIFGVT